MLINVFFDCTLALCNRGLRDKDDHFAQCLFTKGRVKTGRVITRMIRTIETIRFRTHTDDGQTVRLHVVGCVSWFKRHPY